jgi:hypothetical protein
MFTMPCQVATELTGFFQRTGETPDIRSLNRYPFVQALGLLKVASRVKGGDFKS